MFVSRLVCCYAGYLIAAQGQQVVFFHVFFCFFGHCVRQHSIYAQHTFTYVFTYIMQIYAISINWHSFQLRILLKALPIICCVCTVWTHFYWGAEAAVALMTMTLTNCIFSRDGTHTHALIEVVVAIRKVLPFLSSSICYCCRLLIAVNCSAFACTSLTGKVLFLFLFIFSYFFRASATYKLKTLCGQHIQTHLPGCLNMSPSTYKYVCRVCMCVYVFTCLITTLSCLSSLLRLRCFCCCCAGAVQPQQSPRLTLPSAVSACAQPRLRSRQRVRRRRRTSSTSLLLLLLLSALPVKKSWKVRLFAVAMLV